MPVDQVSEAAALTSGQTLSLWMRTSDLLPPDPLLENIECDACIIGGGIAGLTTAYLLARDGRSVVVLDDGPLGGGETCRTTAHLCSEIDDRYFEIERIHGTHGAAMAAQSHAAAINRIEQIAMDERIDCDFERVDGYLFAAAEDSLHALDREYQAALRAGLTVEHVNHAPLAGYDTGRALRFEHQAQFHPLRYLQGLAAAIRRHGGRIMAGHARQPHGGANAYVNTESHPVFCHWIAITTNSPVNDLVAIHTKQAAYRTYVVGLAVPRGSVMPALFWDTADPYHYVRMQRGENDHDIAIIGGEDHKTGQATNAAERWDLLEAWARKLLPMAEGLEFRWSGQVLETIDGLAYIGRNPGDESNVLIATGDSGMGMTHGTIAGMILSDIVAGRENPWADLYRPDRVPLSAAGEYVRENLNVAWQYSEWVSASEIDNPDELPPGTGAVMRRGVSRIAVYKDPQGRVHQMSAICPHLRCVVSWNPAERTWDCPCHGSRFTAEGKAVNGPANQDLERL